MFFSFLVLLLLLLLLGASILNIPWLHKILMFDLNLLRLIVGMMILIILVNSTLGADSTLAAYSNFGSDSIPRADST